MAHRIRLRQPWGCRPHDEKLETDALELIFERRFNRPTGLESDDQVEVEVNALTGRIVEVRLNTIRLEHCPREPLPGQDSLPGQCVRMQMTDLLKDHNLLEVRLRSNECEPELGDVNLWLTAQKNS